MGNSTVMKNFGKTLLIMMLAVSMVFCYSGFVFAEDGTEIMSDENRATVVSQNNTAGLNDAGGTLNPQDEGTVDQGDGSDEGGTGEQGEEPDPGDEPEPEPEPIPDIDISNAVVKLEYGYVRYDGTYKKPAVKSVKLENGKSVKSSAYDVKYSDHKKTGQATVRIVAKEGSGYTGEAIANFYIIGTVSGLKQKSAKVTSIVASWTAYKKVPIDGYKIFKYSSAKKKYIVYKTVKNPKAVKATIKNLKGTHKYSIKIAAYAVDPVTGKTVRGPLSSKVSMMTAPAKPEKGTITSLVNKAPYVQIKWKNLGYTKASRYQICYSKSPDFTSSKTVTIKKSKAKSYKIYGLTGGARYYFRVRAGKMYNNILKYGNWSSSMSLVVNSTGWATIDGKKYYYINGSRVKGSRYVGGEHYYFDPVTGECHGASEKVWERCKNESSDTKYMVTISIDYHRVNVFENVDGEWAMKYQWACTTGENDKVDENGHYTPRGSWQVRFKTKSFGDTFSVWYATNFYKAFYTHSILYNHGSMSVVQDGRLGVSASHGCVRLSMSHAKWIYENCAKGTRVVCNH